MHKHRTTYQTFFLESECSLTTTTTQQPPTETHQSNKQISTRISIVVVVSTGVAKVKLFICSGRSRQVLDDCVRHLARGGRAADIGRKDSVVLDGGAYSALNLVSVHSEVHVAQHHDRRKQRTKWVGLVVSGNVTSNVASTLSIHQTSAPTTAAEAKQSIERQAGKRTDSKMAPRLPTLAPANKPGPPTNALAMLVIIAPYRLGVTMTSNCWGRMANCIEQLSMMISSNCSDGYLSATVRQARRNSPSDNFLSIILVSREAELERERERERERVSASSYWMLALCTAVTLVRLFLMAYSKARSAMRVAASVVMILRLSTTPGEIYRSTTPNNTKQAMVVM
jgi:hypothetical protein